MKLDVNKNIPKSSKQILEKFAYCCFGDTLQDPNEKRFIKKTIPSGGAKHPTEAYFIFPKGSFFPAGVYHYNVKENGFDVISKEDNWDVFHEASYFTYPKNAKNRFGVIYTSMVERAMYRYRDIRSTRAILADVGHAIQNSKFVGLALGLLSITEYKVQDKKIKKILQIDKSNEIVLATQVYFTEYE
jgi:SagB-type dehydrogenase family enzyme